MRLFKLTLVISPDQRPDYDECEFIVDRDDELAWSEIIRYIERLRGAGILNDWSGTAVQPDTPRRVVHLLKMGWNDTLEVIEGGYEEPSSDGGDSPTYRRDMQDAGRGHLLR